MTSRYRIEQLEDRTLLATAFAVTLNNLIRFDTATPETIIDLGPVSGLQPGELVLGIDFRPATGELFALGSTSRLYKLNTATAGATQVGAGPFAPALSGTQFGFDFNPTVDRIRIVSDADQNLRLNPNDATVVDGDNGTLGTQPDANLSYALGDPNAAATPTLVGSAYTNNLNFATTTTLYGIDSALDVLVTQNPPNNGTLNTVGALGINATDTLAFDVQTTAGPTNTAFAAMTTDGVTSSLYTINLATGAATPVGQIGGAGRLVNSMAVSTDGYSSAVVGNVAVFSGSSASSSIAFDQAGGLLRHNRFSAGDSGFASDFDFYSSIPGDQTLSATNPAIAIALNGNDGDDHVTVGSAVAPASGLAASFQIVGGGGGDTLVINDTANSTARNVTVLTNEITGITGPFSHSTLERIVVNLGSGGDAVLVDGIPVQTILNLGGGGDTLTFTTGAALIGGYADGGPGTDTIDYSQAITDPLVNLTENRNLFLATLSGAQQAGVSSSPASGTGFFVLNPAETDLTFSVSANGVTGTINGGNFHNAPRGINGPIVRATIASEQIDTTPPDVEYFGHWTSTDAFGIGGPSTSGPLTPALVAELKNERIYFNIPNSLFPSGEIRGQLTNEGLFGTADNVAGLRGFETVVEPADPFIVTNTNDTGPGSLRNAITAANSLVGANTITFNIPGSGVQTITPLTPLPDIDDTVTIDGYTQPGAKANTHAVGNDAKLLIEINGASAGDTPGLEIFDGGDGSIIRGLVVNRFEKEGIVIRPAADGCTIAGNFIGTDAAGSADLGNGIDGVLIVGALNNTIGGAAPADRNLISGNEGDGIEINDLFPAGGNKILGNYIGTQASGAGDLGNVESGIVLLDSRNNTIGGASAGAGNIISGNDDEGVLIFSFSVPGTANHNTVLGNLIGVDANGVALPNDSDGVFINDADDNVIGGTEPGARNVISGNAANGVVIDGDNNQVPGNYIGLDPTGTLARPNSSSGVVISLGTGNLIGGDTPGARNVISGNTDYGINFVQDGALDNQIFGNYIGTDPTGNLDLGNNRFGIIASAAQNQIGGPLPGQGNLISGNNAGGILIEAEGNIVQGNRIGTNADASALLPNQVNGIAIKEGSLNLIGGLNPGEGNVIAFTSGVGVFVAPGAIFNSIVSNSIFSNGQLGIDLNPDGASADVGDGPTPNDGPGDIDSGGNNLQNTPVLTSAVSSGINTAVTGSLTSGFNLPYLIQFFADPLGDPSGFGEGRVLLGSIFVNSGATATVNFAADLPVPVPAGQRVSATATELNDFLDPVKFRGTSEFSAWVTVSGPPPQISVNDVTVTEGNGTVVTATFTISLSGASTVPTSVTFTTADGTAKQPDDYLMQSQPVVFNPGETTKTVNVAVNPDNVTEGAETFVVNLSNAAGGQILDGQGVGTILDKVVAPPVPPNMNGFEIDDVAFSEGNSGTRQFVFTVTRGGNISGPATVKYKTSNQTAGEGDYNAKSGTLSFAAGQTLKQITVDVKGDTKKESDETFRIELHTANGAIISDNKGIGTIVNDDGGSSNPQPPQPPQPPSIKPKVFIGDASIFEGNSGTRTLTFDVTLDQATSKTVTLKYATQNGSAGEGDYGLKSGTITFAAGQTSKTIQITIKGDTKSENDEQFKVNLSNLVNATLGDGQAIGTIKNDD